MQSLPPKEILKKNADEHIAMLRTLKCHNVKMTSLKTYHPNLSPSYTVSSKNQPLSRINAFKKQYRY